MWILEQHNQESLGKGVLTLHQESLTCIYPQLQRHDAAEYDQRTARQVTMEEKSLLVYKYCFQG